MPSPPSLSRRRVGADALHETGSVDSGSSGSGHSGPLTLPLAEPNMADGSILASALNSPTRSCVEVNYHNAVFSTNNSFAGHGGDGEAAEGAAATGPGGAASSATTAATTVVVNMMPAIVGYFSSSFGNGICAFYSRIFQSKGFSPYQIGILVATNPLLSMTLLPVLSYLADKFRCETAMVLVSIVIASVSMFGYTAIDARFVSAGCFVVMTASRVVMNPLLDQRILMMFPKQGRSSAWSYVRSYAAYGWGIGCFASSLIYSYTGSWVAVTVQYLLGQVGLAYCMIVVKPYERIERVPVRFVEVLKLLGGNQRLMLFLFASTMMGTGYSFIDNFLFLFLGELGGSEALMGFTVVLTVSTEIPLFQMSARLHELLTERQMMTIAMGVWASRVVCYSLLTKAWAVLLIEPLHGVTFAFMWLPSVHIISRAFPPKLSSSATGVLFTLTSGLGPMIGNLIAGTLYTLIGPCKMFLCAAVVMTAALIFYQVMDHVLERRGIPILYDPEAVLPTSAATDVAVATESVPHEAAAHLPTAGSSESGSGDKKGTASSGSDVGQSRIVTHCMEVEGVSGGRTTAADPTEDELPL